MDGNGGLKIGKNCSISAGVQILTHDTVKWALSGGKCSYEYDSTSIGDCCFLGSHAVITKGVKIGKHSIVAAGAVVTKCFDDYSVVAGIPAKKIGFVKVDADKVEICYES